MAKNSSTSDRREFLRAADLPRKGSSVIKFGQSIRTFKGDYGVQLIVAVSVNDAEFDFSIRVNSANHIALEKKFGRNLLGWAGKSIRATVETFDSDEGRKDYIALEGSNERGERGRRER